MPANTLTAPSRSSEASATGKGRGSPPPSADMIRFACGSCGEKLSVPEKYAGRKGACPNCGNVNRVPTGGDVGEVVRPVAKPAPKPIYVGLPPPAARESATPESPAPAADPAHTPYADHAAAPVPSRNTGAELAERPERWTRAPIQIEADEDETDHGAGGLLRFFVDGSEEENEWVLGHRRQWQVDKRGLPLVAKVALLLASVFALIGLVWGFFYLLLKVVIAANG